MNIYKYTQQYVYTRGYIGQQLIPANFGVIFGEIQKLIQISEYTYDRIYMHTCDWVSKQLIRQFLYHVRQNAGIYSDIGIQIYIQSCIHTYQWLGQ